MALQTNNLVKLVFLIFVVFSCIYGFPSEWKSDEESAFGRHLLSSKQCVKHNSTFGQREPRDMLTEVFKITERNKWMSRAKHIITYNRKNKNPNNTTMIEIINNDKGCKCFAPEIKLVDGGVYKAFGNFTIESEKNCGIDMLVRIFCK